TPSDPRSPGRTAPRAPGLAGSRPSPQPHSRSSQPDPRLPDPGHAPAGLGKYPPAPYSPRRPAPSPRLPRPQPPDPGMRPGEGTHQRDSGLDRSIRSGPRDAHQTADGLHQQGVVGQLGALTRTESGDRTVDQTAVVDVEVRVTPAETSHRARAEVFHDQVRAAGQLTHRLDVPSKIGRAY